MKFVVSSTELLSHLSVVSRVISSKNTLPILDNFLFKLEGNNLEITASDLETTLTTSIQLENVTQGGEVAIPYRILVDTLKEFPEQPLTFDINLDTLATTVKTETGQFNIVGQPAEDFPAKATVKDESKVSVSLSANALLNGITKTIFATADDEMRPVMNGILFELASDSLTFVASDAHKLVRYRRLDVKCDEEKSFILPKKPATLLKNILGKGNATVTVEFDDKNAVFALPGYNMVCRLVEGVYPNYNSVIPTNNPNVLTADRVEFYNSLRRVAPFANQASNLVKLSLSGNQLMTSAQDLDFSISAYERFNCQYEGEEMEIGFKSTFLIEILANISASDVMMSLSDPSRAGLFFPAVKENEDEDVLMLLMPMMVNA
ncbi:MAG TPA: DNA polymerase III subunit beta [Tenuifilaceae bacterium]|nr:DNA polymerase III subunit beta [Tenuifilaceae bacterium]HPE19012.1 DNA polymerase III subunit beta [Tenuifilaceae bacterium]HPJ46848.1 DNA polymerase III subunit beta [Tenuifilaceae bacterium]HRX68371.1 DNA polymerase III subunit beta [Tenuifilaceae bacterium]